MRDVGNDSGKSEPNGRTADPFRVVIGAFRDGAALAPALRSLAADGPEPDGMDVVLPPPAEAQSYLANGIPDPLGVLTSDPRGAGRRRRCLKLLRDRYLLVIAIADSVPARGEMEETLAEHGALIVGIDGRLYPKPPADAGREESAAGHA